MFQRISATLLVVCLLTSCGGGGGDSGGSSSSSSSSSSGGGSSIRFTPDRTSVELAYDEDASFMPSASVVVTATGTFNGTLYIGAIVEGNGIDPEVTSFISGTVAEFTLQARRGLEAGTYSGRVQFLACSDQACSRQIGNSPVIVNYVLTVRATLEATPARIDATSQSGGTTTQEVSIRLPEGAASFSATPGLGGEWFSIDQLTTTGFRVNLRSLPPGSFSGSILVSAGTSQLSIPVSYSVTDGVPYVPLGVAPHNLTLTGTEGVVNAPVSLDVTAPSWDPVTSVRFIGGANDDPVAWLSASPVAGGYSIVADATNLGAGAYTARAVVSGAYPSQDLYVPIAFTVGEGLVLPADVLKTIESESTIATLGGTVPVDVAAGPPANWTAQSSAPWLTLTDAAGVSGETLAFEIDPSQLAYLPNGGGEEVAQITITPERTTMSPRTFAVRVSKRLAAVTSVGPYLQPTGRDTRVILRGIGFDGVQDLGARLQFTGGDVSQVTRVNDTELVVHTGPLALGNFSFSFTNALDEQVASAELRTFTPQTFANAALATGGELRGLFYDAERSSVYLVNVGLESLQRFHFDTQWESASLSVPAILSAGLTQDGSRLMVASSSMGLSRIRQLDAADMNVQISYADLPVPLYRGFTYLTGVIPSTNDGRAWFTVGSTWNDLAYFDPASEQMTIVNPSFSTSFYGGPWFAVSRDGERLMIPQSGSISPQPPALYLDAADSEVRINPAGLTNTYRMSLSDDADRYLHDSLVVRDRDFGLIGHIPNPLPRLTDEPDYYVREAVLSPDGNRVYAVAYPDAFDYEGFPARVYVIDSSTRQTSDDELPVLGYVDLSDYPSCTYYTSQDCNSVVHSAISPDGDNLFVAGNRNLLVLPAANATLQPIANAPPAVLQKGGRTNFVPWRLDLSN